MLDLLIDLGWKSALVAGAALVAVRAMRGRAAAERVLLLRVALAVLLLLPGLALLLPALDLALLPAPVTLPVAMDMDVIPTIPAAEAPLAVASGSLYPLAMVYAGGVALVLLHFAAGIATLWRWTRAARPAADVRWTEAFARGSAGLRRPVRLRVSPRVATPMSWGVAPAWVLIGAALERNPSEAEAVVAHELAHVRRFDWPVLVASRLAIALYWFNPLMWLLDRALVREAEFAADDAAVRHVARADYAQTLLAVAMPGGRQPACGMAMGNSALARRIRRLLDERAPHPASRLLGALMLAGGAAAMVPLAAARIVPAEPLTIAGLQDLVRTQGAVREGAPAASVPALRTLSVALPAAAPGSGAPQTTARTVAAPKIRPATPSAGTGLAALPAPARVPIPAAIDRLPDADASSRSAQLAILEKWIPQIRPAAEARQQRAGADQGSDEESYSEPQGASRLQRMRRWIDRLRSEAGRLENAARYYPDSSDVRTAYIKAASEARRQAQVLERDMQKLSPGQ